VKRTTTILMAIVTILFTCQVLPARDYIDKWLAKKPIVKRVEIQGNENISKDEIKNAISTKEQGFWQKLRLKSKIHLRKNSQRLDGAALEYLYKNVGFLDISYEFEYKIADDSSAIVLIHINEGNRYYIDSVIIVDDLGAKQERIDKLISRLKSGDYLNPYKIKAVASAVRGIYANDGHPHARVNYFINPLWDDSTRQQVVFSIDPGPLTIISDIKVDSLKYTSSRVVTRELLFKPGDLYSRKKLVESRQRIYSSGLFTYVDFKTDISPDSQAIEPMLTINAVERKPKFVRIKTGAAQDTTYDMVWDLALETGSRNISGMGRSFRFMPSLSFQVISGWQLIEEKFSFHYTEPWPFGFRMPLNFAFTWEPRLQRAGRDYKIENFRFAISTLNELGLYIKIRSGFEFEKVDISGIAPELIDIFKRDEDISEGRSFLITFERDSRQNIFVPRSGSVIRLSGQYYGNFLGGDKNFYKLVGEYSRYMGISRWDVFAFRFKSGWAISMEDDDFIPVTDLFFLGGANTIRGYKENDVGPKVMNSEGELEASGGKFYFIANQEWRRYLVGKFWMSLFLDVGGNWRDHKDFHFRDLLATLGVGIQYVSPLGPIRLDYGQRLAWKPVVPGGRIHISILYAF
jgi:outer membrane protein insertion porin family